MLVLEANRSASGHTCWCQCVFPRAIALIVFAYVALCPVELPAVEQAEAFVKGLRERGLHEQALEYIDRLETSRLVDETTRRQIPYYRGLTLIDQSRQTVDPAAQSRLLADARAQLEQFATFNPTSAEAAEAQLQLATALVEQGKKNIAQAEQLPSGAAFDAQRTAARQQARREFEDAQPMFRQAEEIYTAELAKLPATLDPQDKEGHANRRQEYRGRLAQVRVLAAQSRFELAQMFSPDSPEYRNQLEATAKELATLYEEHSRWLIGFFARLYEGRCYQALGQYQLALGCYEDILAQPKVLPHFRSLMAKANRHRAECFLKQEQNDAAIESCSVWLKDARSAEEEQPDWLAVRFRLAEALQRKGETLPDGSLDRRKLLAEARDAYLVVSASPNEFQTAARAAAASLGRERSKPKDDPRGFQEAYELGKQALASLNAAKLALPTATENNPAAVPELNAQIEQGKQDAWRYFQAAMSLLDDGAGVAARNEVRYFLCWLSYDNKDYYRAAVLGEFLALRYPDDPAAPSAAKIAMASYEQLFHLAAQTEAAHSDGDFEARRMARMAEFITRRWPNSKDADAAFSVLVSYSIRKNRIDEAQSLLAKVSDQYRPRLKLQLGIAMWSRYLEVSRPNAKTPLDEAALSHLKATAVELLHTGIEAARSEGDASEATATASLYMAQAMLDDAKYAEAIELLEDRPRGPLTLIAENKAAAMRPGYAIEVYKAALRAYVSVNPPQGGKAVAVMDSLERAVGEGKQSAAQLTRIYIGLGVALQQQINELRSDGRDADAQRVSAAFMELLDRIAARQVNATWADRSWTAQTYYNLAAGQRDAARLPLLSEGQTQTATHSISTKEYFTKARDALRQLLEAAAADSNYAPGDNALLAAKLHLGECYRELGEYELALNTFSSVLKEKETSLSVQRAAALTYQERGEKENYQWLERAIHGGYQVKSTGKNRIWGWVKLAQVAERAARTKATYRDTFFEARLNATRCRYLIGMKHQGADREQNLAKAKQSIRLMMQLYPNFGSERWRSEFDALLKKIQTAAGKEPVGLQEFTAPRSP